MALGEAWAYLAPAAAGAGGIAIVAGAREMSARRCWAAGGSPWS